MNFLPPVNDYVKSIDDHKMVITIEPEIYISWQDLRWTVASPNYTLLPDSMLENMWYPKIIADRMTKRSNPYHDPGNIGMYQSTSFEDDCKSLPKLINTLLAPHKNQN